MFLVFSVFVLTVLSACKSTGYSSGMAFGGVAELSTPFSPVTSTKLIPKTF